LTAAPVRRPIRSFVLRQGRISAAQQRAHERLMPRYGIGFECRVLDLAAVFGRAAPKIVEVGFGMGETTAQIAAEHPENDYLGIEVHRPGVGSLLRQIEARSLSNVRIVQHDAVEVLREMLGPATLDAIHIFFPDPWPKLRHHKRRLIQVEFAALVGSRLKPGGYIHVATDWDNYAQHILKVLEAKPELVNTARDFAPRPRYRPLTKFEQRGLDLGHAVRDIIFKRA
jgi:tRNA (guanine-N7-)-methyltransferase